MKDKQKYRKQMPEDTKAVIGLFIIVIEIGRASCRERV